LIGTEVGEGVPEKAREAIQGAIREGRETHVEHEMVRRDGTVITVEGHGRTVYYEGRQVRFTAIRDITERKRLENLQAFLAQVGDGAGEEPFFNALARYLAQNLGMDFVCIDRLEGDGLNATTLAVWSDDHFEDNVTYALRDTPCGDVVGKEVCCFPASVCQFFPKDRVLKELRAESYIGVTLWGHTGRPIGLIAVIGRSPMASRPASEAVLRRVAVRAAAELERMDAEASVRENEARFHAAFDEGAVPMVLASLDTKLLKANAAFCRMLGFSESELIGRSFMEFTHPDDLGVNRAGVTRLADGEISTFRMEKRYIRKDGTVIWVDLSTASVRDDQDRPTYLVTHVQDITDRKQAEEALKRDERVKTELLEKLNQAQRMGMIGSWEWDLRAGGVWWSDETYHIFGVTPQEYIPSFESNGRFIHPDDLATCTAAFENCLQTDEALDFDVRLVLRDGTLKHCNSKGRIIHGDDGRPLRFVGTIMDITERKQTEDALRAGERRERERAEELAVLFEAVPVPVFIARDPDCLHLTGNRLADDILRIPHGDELSMSAPEEARPQHFRVLKDGRELRLDEMPAQRAARGEHVRDFEFSILFDDGMVRHLLGYGTPLLDDQGNPRGTVASLVDITGRKRAEEQLAELTRRLTFHVDNSPLAVIEWGADMRLVRWSGAAEQVFGWTADEVLGKRMEDLRWIYEEDQPQVADVSGDLQSGANPRRFSANRNYRKDGSVAHCEWYNSSFMDESGKLRSILSLVLDVTERHRAEQEVQKLASVVRHSREFINIATPEGMMVFLNEAGAEMVGLSAAAVGQTHILQIIPDHLRDKVENEVLPALRLKGFWEGELQYRNLLTGAFVDVHAATFTVKDPVGSRPLFLVNTSIDITERKRAEEALRRSHDELEQRVQERTQELSSVNETLLDRIDQHTRTLEALRESAVRLAEAQRMAHLGNWNWDAATNVAHWSDETCRLLGFEPEKAAPSYNLFMQRVYPDDRQQVDTEIKEAVTGKGACRSVFRVILPNDEIRHLSAQAEVLLNEKGKLAGLAGTLMDITEQVRTREEARVRHQQLVQADKMVSLGILTSGVAHEINNPNHAIMSNTTLFAEAWNSIHPILEREYQDMGDFVIGGFDYSRGREEYPKMLSDIVNASRRIERIVTELRDFARYSPEETLSPIDAPPVVESACLLLSSMIKKSTDHFSVSHEENLPKILANRQRIEQVIINLIQNACQSLPGKDRQLTVSTSHSAEKEAVLITIIDEGTGISEENLKHLGDPFFTTKRGFGGTGLGLWVSFNIVREHGGILEFFSTPGKGTRAVLTLRASLPQ
jgi:PAS domain S-box-containing protein